MGQHQSPLIKNQKQAAINVLNLNQGWEKMQKEWSVDMLTWRGQVSSEVQDVQP